MLDVSQQDFHWRVLKIGQDPARPPHNYIEQWRRQYAEFKDIPIKTQEAVAALSMCEDSGRIEGIGQRVSSSTFWLDDRVELLKEYIE